ncbi:MAG TPA: serine/threonine-protein kinase [Gemmatimonadaceae bacterium]|nr:serine/threonine-protein kinase [Gemmatimonadaceae bacterium]
MTDPLLDRLVVAVGTQYLVDREIGRGGMAVVYRATDLRLHRQVAIKVLPPELAFNADVRERFLREAQTAAQLSHPGIVPIYTVDETNGLVFFVMALVEGESLAERLARDTRLPVDEARQILIGVADALAYAGAHGVVHRDVKPDNIMLDRRTGRPMVTDFGIARAAAGDTRLTVTGIAIGTPAYMSPEQALGDRDLDARSDVYSLGVIGYQMLAGETPFKASNTPAMLVKHVSEMPRPLLSLRPDVPPALAYAISRALAKKPEERWPDAGAFRDALASTAAEPAPAPPSVAPASLPVLPPNDAAPPAPYPMGLPPESAPMPPMPVWGTRTEWREWRYRQRQWEREQQSLRRGLRRGGRGEDDDPTRPLEDRISRFRRRGIGALGTVASLAVVNGLTSPHFPWFIFPSAFILIGTATHAGKLWADGVPLSRLFSRGAPPLPARSSAAQLPAVNAGQEALSLAPADVLAGPYGEGVRRAAADRAAARDILARLAPAERGMIPDVAPTLDALAERVGALALTLHRLDADLAGASPDTLERRLGVLRAEAGPEPTAEQERRITLLERQRASIAELTERRGTLAAQIESAGLALQNLRLDLLKLRSSGLGSAMSDVTNATQEARALSREIGHAVDAANEVRRM